MGVRAFFSKPLAKYVVKQYKKWAQTPHQIQQEVMTELVKKAASTAFGKDHHFDQINSYEDFKKHVPIRDYEGLRPYVERVVNGEGNVLWKGLPIYFAKTSGTTSG